MRALLVALAALTGSACGGARAVSGPVESAPDPFAAVVEAQLPTLEPCARAHPLSTLIELEWTFRRGQTVALDVVRAQGGHPDLVRCVWDKASQWPFPETLQGKRTWTFKFTVDR